MTIATHIHEIAHAVAGVVVEKVARKHVSASERALIRPEPRNANSGPSLPGLSVLLQEARR